MNALGLGVVVVQISVSVVSEIAQLFSPLNSLGGLLCCGTVHETNEAKSFGYTMTISHDGRTLDLSKLVEEFSKVLVGEAGILGETLHVHVVERATGSLTLLALVLKNGEQTRDAIAIG